jgi:hypothetical protein
MKMPKQQHIPANHADYEKLEKYLSSITPSYSIPHPFSPFLSI